MLDERRLGAERVRALTALATAINGLIERHESGELSDQEFKDLYRRLVGRAYEDYQLVSLPPTNIGD